MKRVDELFRKLGYSRENGLFYHDEAEVWFHKFPYRLSRVLRDIIKPYAFFCLFHGKEPGNREHPEPLNNPFILFFNNPTRAIEKEIPGWTFSFGQAPVVIITRDDELSLDIYHGYAFDGEREWLKRIEPDLEDLSVTNLAIGKTWQKLYKKYFQNTPKVDKFLLRNLTDARRILIAKDEGGLSAKTANRLIGRSLFIRYLIDRKVSFEDDRYIRGEDKKTRQESFEHLLKDKNRLYEFFSNIMNKFNGDLFPLIDKDDNNAIIYDEESTVTQKHLDVIYYLFSCSSFFDEKGDGFNSYTVQKSLFRFYDFEVIPVELISNIYENFLGESRKVRGKNIKLREFSGSRQEEIKAYYTPPFLVDYILAQTVTPYLDEQEEASCRVLDPACGSGIFLVETLRKIIEKEMLVNPRKGPDNRLIVPDDRLWQLVRENIFGIDIDEEAIEITIFSLYITLLDYKTPKEIKNFRFEQLRNKNLFAGKEADFFNEEHAFNTKFKKEIDLDFIIGNPPWGVVKTSRYYEYIKNRNEIEKTENPREHIELTILKKEISQAFMIRVSDFIKPAKDTKCVFIVTGKNIYNTSGPMKSWRNYFLNKFHVTQVFELSSVNNKIVGGNKIFEAADQSAVIVFFHPAGKNDDTSRNMVRHITVRPNRFFNYFKTIVIEKPDFKRIKQKYFMESKGGYDWLWKILVHGNILDFYFIKRLKEEFPAIKKLMKKYKLAYHGGLKPIDNSISPEKRKNTENIRNWDFLEVNSGKDFQQFKISPSKTWEKKAGELASEKRNRIYEDMKVGSLPDNYFFTGKKLLFKKGLLADDDFKGVSAFSNDNIVFTSTVCSVKPGKETGYTPAVETILKNMAGLINSRLFTYFILCTGSSLGIGRTRADFEEFFSFPIAREESIGRLTIEIQEALNKLERNPLDSQLKNQLRQYREELKSAINDAYGISEQELSLVDYAIEVSLPVLKREEDRNSKHADIFRPLSPGSRADREYLTRYAQVFIDHFSVRFAAEHKYFFVDIHVTPGFTGFHFNVSGKRNVDGQVSFKNSKDEIEMINTIGDLGIYNLSKDLYIQQDIRGFNKSSFYVIKPNRKKYWHKAAAFADLSEFIDSLVKAESRRRREIA